MLIRRLLKMTTATRRRRRNLNFLHFIFFFFCIIISVVNGSIESNELEEGPLRILRNANHHDHSSDADHHHAKEEDNLFDRAARVGLRIIDGKDREGANDLGNDLDFLGHHDHLHQQEVEEIRKLLNSGVSLGELFSTSIVRTTTPKAQITESTVRLPIKDHGHWLDSPTELVVHDAVAEPVFRPLDGAALETTTSIEYLTETPYHFENEVQQRSHEPLLINDRAYDYYEDYYDYDYYDDEIFDTRNDTRTPRTPRSFDDEERKRIGRRILSAGPAHLTMSDRDMEHMMMMFLHNAVTQVEMESGSTSQDVNRANQNRRPKNQGNQRRQQRLRQQKKLREERRRKQELMKQQREEERQRQIQRQEEAEKAEEERRAKAFEEEVRRQKEIDERRRQEQEQRRVAEQERRRQQEQRQRQQELQDQEALRQQQLEEQRRLQQDQLRKELEQQQRLQFQLQQQELVPPEPLQPPPQSTRRPRPTVPVNSRRNRPTRPPRPTSRPTRPPRPTSRPTRPTIRPTRPPVPTTRPTQPTPRPTRPPRPNRPIAVAQVKPPVRSESPSLNQIPRQSKAKKAKNFDNKRRGKTTFRSRSGRNRIFPPPPNIPVTNFNCGNYEFPGLYADTEANCEVFHMCQSNGHVSSFKCPKGTRFDQRMLVCNWAVRVNCEDSADFFNRDIYT